MLVGFACFCLAMCLILFVSLICSGQETNSLERSESFMKTLDRNPTRTRNVYMYMYVYMRIYMHMYMYVYVHMYINISYIYHIHIVCIYVYDIYIHYITYI